MPRTFNVGFPVGYGSDQYLNADPMDYLPGMFDSPTSPTLDEPSPTPSSASGSSSHSITRFDPISEANSSGNPASPTSPLASSVITPGDPSRGQELPSDETVARYFQIERVPGTDQPTRNRGNRGEKPRPKELTAHHCLWCKNWTGYSKEKARNHIFVHLGIKPIACDYPDW